VIRSIDFHDNLAKWTAIEVIEGIGQCVETVSGIDDRWNSMFFRECQRFFHVSSRAMAHTLNLPILEVVFKTEFPKWDPSKINPEKVHVFRARILTINSPAFTSNPPQLHHQKTTPNHPFSPPPQQKRSSTTPKKLLQKRSSSTLRTSGAPNPRKLSTKESGPGNVPNPKGQEDSLEGIQLRLRG
jgi:hypothetical protein